MSRVAYLAPYAIKQSRSISPSRKPPSLEEEEIFGIVMVQSSVLALVVKIQLLKDFGVRDIYSEIKLNFQAVTMFTAINTVKKCPELSPV